MSKVDDSFKKLGYIQWFGLSVGILQVIVQFVGFYFAGFAWDRIMHFAIGVAFIAWFTYSMIDSKKRHKEYKNLIDKFDKHNKWIKFHE